MKTARTLLLLAALLVAVPFLAACGDEGTDEATAQGSISGQDQEHSTAETEGIYVDVDGIKYQVQTSKLLNPQIALDKDYLEGVTGPQLQLADDEVWFVVLLRAENDEGKAGTRTADDFVIEDSQGGRYSPLPLAASNNFAWRPIALGEGEVYPDPESTPGERPPYGAELLFKLKRVSLGNRPLELHIESGESEQSATLNLDV